MAVRGVINSFTGRSAKASTPDTTTISSAEASASVSALESTAARVERAEGSRHGMKAPRGRPRRSSHGTACATIGSAQRRSEEHTSELQSLAYLVCRLLLEKKKQKSKRRLFALT